MMHRPSMMHGGGGYPNARPSMMHGPGAGHNKRDRPSLAPNRDRGGYDEGEIGEISEMRDGSVSREPWDAGNRDQRWGRGLERRHSGAYAGGAEEDGELPVGGGGGARPPLPAGRPPPDASYARTSSRDILKSVSAAPTPTMEPFAGAGAGPAARLARHVSAPVPGDAAGDPESPAPKRKKLGWGQGLARSKSTGAGLESPAYPDRPPSAPISEDARAEANRTPPLPGGNPFLSGDDSRSGAPSPSPMGGNAARVPLVDPVARAAAAAATKAEAAARREMLAGAEKSKAEILRAMEETDARIASLELSIAESEDRERSDREQMDEQRQHQEARLRRELEGVKSGVERAEKASKRAAAFARERNERAEEMRRKAGLIDAEEKEKEAKEKGGKKGTKKKKGSDVDSAAARASARAVQRMLAGREPRVALVERLHKRNARLAEASHLGLKTTCGLELPHEVTSVSVETIATANASREQNDPRRAAVRRAVTNVARARREATREKALNLAVTYLKRRERWRLHMQLEDLRLFEKEMGVRPGGKLPTQGTRGSSRHAGASGGFGFGGSRGSFGGAARSEYEELQMIQELQARERLKTLVKLQNQILDPEELRLSLFTSNRNSLVEDPKAELATEKRTRPWVEWEKKIFHEKFASYGKNFKLIATFID